MNYPPRAEVLAALARALMDLDRTRDLANVSDDITLPEYLEVKRVRREVEALYRLLAPTTRDRPGEGP